MRRQMTEIRNYGLEDVLQETWILESSVPIFPILFHQQSVTLF